jgi:hypothetical protein
MSAVVTYLLLLAGAMGVALTLYFTFRAIKLI